LLLNEWRKQKTGEIWDQFHTNKTYPASNEEGKKKNGIPGEQMTRLSDDMATVSLHNTFL
jgi:hypothetical protein